MSFFYNHFFESHKAGYLGYPFNDDRDLDLFDDLIDDLFCSLKLLITRIEFPILSSSLFLAHIKTSFPSSFLTSF